MQGPNGSIRELVSVHRQPATYCKQNILQATEQAAQTQMTFTQAPIDASCLNTSAFEINCQI